VFTIHPRRLALMMSSVASRQPDQVLERKGPALRAAFDENKQATPAALGFARSVARQVDELETLKTEQGEWLFCRIKKAGENLQTLFYPMLERSLAALPVAKPMRWSDHDYSFVRPVHWLLVLHGKGVIAGQLFGHEAGRLTRGHRIHSPGEVAVDSADDYVKVLEREHVLADPHMRQARIEQQILKLGHVGGDEALVDTDLLQEVTNLVEWPCAIACNFDPEFLAVPAQALIASMQDHQKFFPIRSKEGELRARFIAIANLESRDVDAVRKGFERVIRPRLADARFFWEVDKKSTADSWLKALGKIVFQNKLGSVGDKSKRICEISKTIALDCNLDVSSAQRAALLCKCDLVSQMVSEFPELQGLMGRYYARHWGEAEVVAEAIGDHYLPAFSGDSLPVGVIGKVVALSDRVDTLTGIFSAGLKPTGNKDPFALRRAALGLIRILLDGQVVIDLDRLLEISALALQEQVSVTPETLLQVRSFIIERLKHYLCDAGHDTGIVNAALDAPLSSLADLGTRLEALQEFMQLEIAGKLVAANKRISNILRKSGLETKDSVLEDRLNIKEEIRLFEDVRDISVKLDTLHLQADYRTSLDMLAGLSDSIEAFFEHVMVMDKDTDLRNNRLNLLTMLKSQFDRIANLALIA